MVIYKRITKIIFISLNALVAVLYLLSCLAPVSDPVKYWPIALLGFAFPFLLITQIALVFFWLIFRPRWLLLSLLTLPFGYQSLNQLFAFHIENRFDFAKKPGDIRVVHWNVARFVEWRRNNNKGSQTRLKMMDQLKEQNADILCLQEFFTSTDPVYYNNLDYIRKELNYPYYYYSRDNDGYLQYMGQIILSRIPLIDSGLVRFKEPSQPESLIYADFLLDKDTFRIYTTHLQSLKFKKEDYEHIEEITSPDAKVVKNSRSIFSKVRTALSLRKLQTGQVVEAIDQSPHPYLLTGDFNDIPNSYCYTTITRNRLQDVFLEQGMGIGRTYSYIAPTLRIDYMLGTPGINFTQFNRVMRNYSDHYMLVTDFHLKKP